MYKFYIFYILCASLYIYIYIYHIYIYIIYISLVKCVTKNSFNQEQHILTHEKVYIFLQDLHQFNFIRATPV